MYDTPLEMYLSGPLGHIVAGLLGALFGSFANVCIYRWPPTDEHPEGRSVVRPGSHCSSCQVPIRIYDNIPILSYFLLRGRCRSCGVSFSPRYLFVEGATTMLFVAVYHLQVVLMYSWDPPELRLLRFAIAAGFVFVMMVIAFIDLDHKLILNRITYPAIPIFYGLSTYLPENDWKHGLIGAAVGYGVIRLVADGYYLLTRRHGLGYGDGKLLAIVGAYLGWQAVVVSLFLGSIIGSVVGTTWLLLARRRGDDAPDAVSDNQPEAEPLSDSESATDEQRDEAELVDVPLRHVEIPFGPFLAAAALAYAFLEPWLRINFAVLYS